MLKKVQCMHMLYCVRNDLMKSHLNITVRLIEYLKYLRNICCVMANHGKDQETHQASHTTVS